MVQRLGFNLAETTLARPLQTGGQAQQEPNLVKAPTVESECEENPAQSDKRPVMLETGTVKNELSRKLT